MGREYNYMSDEDRRVVDAREDRIKAQREQIDAEIAWRKKEQERYEKEKKIEWLLVSVDQRDETISRAVEEIALKKLINEGIASLESYINASGSLQGKRREFELWGKQIQWGARPEHVKNAKAIRTLLEQVKHLLHHGSAGQTMSDFNFKLDLYAPDVKSTGKYRGIFNALKQTSNTNTSEYRKDIAIQAIEKSIKESVGSILAEELIGLIMGYINTLPADAFHGRDVDDYHSQFSRG